MHNPAILKILSIDVIPESIKDLQHKIEGFNLAGSYKECVNTQQTLEFNDVLSFDKHLKIFFAPIVNVNHIIDYVIIIEDITQAILLDRSKDEFFAVASHELRTPLAAIQGNADMMLDMYKNEIKNEELKAMLSDINLASARLIKIVNNFLEVSKLEQGKISSNPESFQLSNLVNKVLKSLEDSAKNKKLVLSYNLPIVTLPTVFADKIQTEQVLLNLVSNAIKFTENGSVTVDTEVSDGFITVRIVDTGKGIETKNQTLLFKKFQQAGGDIFVGDYATSSGLGLYISKMLINKNGGDIGIEKSESDVGSTFFFTLPMTM